MVVKTPINAFRIGYVAGVFPAARFVHVVRAGADVARSIAARAATGPWYGRGGSKWDALAQAARDAGLDHEVALCEDDLDRGVLEWRLAVTAARRSLASLDPGRGLEVRYSDLVETPGETADALVAFAGLRSAAQVVDYALREVRPAGGRHQPPVPPRWSVIAGPLAPDLAG
jgi:hypothetical protein